MRAGAKQYRYHADWRTARDEAKYHRLCAFGRALPRLRRRVEADLASHGLGRERVLAGVVRLLEVTLIRVGNDEYAKTNKSFGLTTLRKRHVKLTSLGAQFEFRGKSGVEHRTSFHDRRIATLRCAAARTLRGQRLFQYLDEAGERQGRSRAPTSTPTCARPWARTSRPRISGTWAGTLLAARALAMAPAADSETAAKREINVAVKARVAGLRAGQHTPTVCRACYVHPAAFDAYRAGTLSPALKGEARPAELALLKLLDDAGACA